MQKIQRIQFRSLIIDYRSVVLHLHRNFTTAHSTSATRTNFFIRVGSGRPEMYMKTYGYGQCGLPPKKPGCYMSDINDCFQFMSVFSERLKQENEYKVVELTGLPENVSNQLESLKSSLKNQIVHLLKICQQYEEKEDFRAPKCALQFALLDLLTNYHGTTVQKLLFPDFKQDHEVYSFYTASYQANQQMIQNTKEHLKITKCIKFKYNNNVAELLKLLANVHKEQLGEKLIVDANSSWTIQNMRDFLQGLKKIENYEVLIKKILYIQQPFSLKIEDYEQWEEVKNTSPIKILADQSFRNEKDIERIKKIAHAVNIKTQKTGGPFSTLKAGLRAKEEGLQVIFGSMCSTLLGCTQTFQFYPLAEFMDIDGALLVKQPQLEGGFEWQENGKVVPYKTGFGLKVNAERLFEQ